MSTATSLLERLEPYDAYRWAVKLFELKDYYRAAEVRELLARSYYHSAQLSRAADAARDLLAHEPTNAYAALLLARSLERASRLEEADAARRLAVALGAPA